VHCLEILGVDKEINAITRAIVLNNTLIQP